MGDAISTGKKAPYRIHFKVEGDFVECFYAEMDTLKGAVLLGTTRRSLLEANPMLWEAWKLMMHGAFRDEIQRLTGVNVIDNKTN